MKHRAWIGAAAVAFALAVPGARGAGDDLGVPANGLDLVRVADGRILRCKAGAPTPEGKVPLEFPSATVLVPKARVVAVRRFADFDPAPRTPEEVEKVAKGLVRWDGKWIEKARADSMREAEVAATRKRREEDMAHATWDKRWKRDTDHFAIEANISSESLDFYSALLEDYYDFFTKCFQVKLTQREKKQKLPVYFFRRRDEFRQFHDKDTGGKSEHLLGYFVPVKGAERLVLFDSPDGRQETLDVLFHEGTHFIIHLANPQVLTSRWIHEGCAEYFGASTYSGKKFQPGHVQDGRLLHFQWMIANNKVLSMDEVMKAGNPAAKGEGTPFEGEHYAQAWTLVHFLLHGKNGKYKAGFIDYVGRWLGGKGVKYQAIAATDRKFIDYEEDRAILLRCLGLKDFDGLTKELIEYAKALPLRGARAYVMKGEIDLYERNDAQAAEKDFQAALEKGGNDPAVLADLARAFSSIPGKEGEVESLLRKSLDIDPLDAWNRFFLARRLPPEESMKELRLCTEIDPEHARALGDLAWLLYVHRLQDHLRAQTPEDQAVAKDALDLALRAIALDAAASNYHTAASLHLVRGEFEKGRDAETRALELEPEVQPYLARLAEAYAVLADADRFSKLLRRLDLLLRRPASVREGATEPSMPATSPEEARSIVTNVIAHAVERCVSWEKYAEAVRAVGSWFERRPPANEEEWTLYAMVVSRAGQKKRAGKIAADGLKAFPDAVVLQGIVHEGESAPEDPAPSGGPLGGPGEAAGADGGKKDTGKKE